MGVKRVSALTEDQRARMDEWADRWIEVGLRTGPADRERFEAAVGECYRFAGLEPPRRVVWVGSPLVMAIAAPIAGWLSQGGPVRDAAVGAPRSVTNAVIRAVHGAAASHGAVHGAVTNAVDDAVAEAVRGAAANAVTNAVTNAVHDALAGAVTNAVDGAVHHAVNDAVRDAADNAATIVRDNWYRYIGGQFWGVAWCAWRSYFREVCDLELPGDLWDRSRAFEATCETACWWWPHRDFVVAVEHPTVIHRELVDPSRPRGWGSHRLHSDTGPAIAWPDGWGVWAIHGVRVPRQVVEAPHTLTLAQVNAEENAEVRRVMIDRFGVGRFMRESGAVLVDEDVEWGRLWRLDGDGDEPRVMVEVVNSTLEADGSSKRYWLRVPPDMVSAHGAVAWTFGLDPAEYRPVQQT